jgi:hypothetical protein
VIEDINESLRGEGFTLHIRTRTSKNGFVFGPGLLLVRNGGWDIHTLGEPLMKKKTGGDASTIAPTTRVRGGLALGFCVELLVPHLVIGRGMIFISEEHERRKHGERRVTNRGGFWEPESGDLYERRVYVGVRRKTELRPLRQRHVRRVDFDWGYQLEVPTVRRRVRLKFICVNEGSTLTTVMGVDRVHGRWDQSPPLIHVPARAISDVEGPALFVEASPYAY